MCYYISESRINMINDNNDLNFSCKTSWLDDIYLGTKESQGIRNAANAIKFVLFDDISVYYLMVLNILTNMNLFQLVVVDVLKQNY